tara:strand:- start:107 stop:289 length:183 start_codon:yes stop_codon:yes gene_type:complete
MAIYILEKHTVKGQLDFFTITSYLKQHKQKQGVNDNGRILPKTKEKEEKAKTWKIKLDIC